MPRQYHPPPCSSFIWRGIFFRTILVSAILLSQSNYSYGGVKDLIRGLRQLVGSNAADHMDHLIRSSPGRFLDASELEALVRTIDRTDPGDWIANRSLLSSQQRSQARIVDRLIYEAEAVLDVPNPNLSRFTSGVVKIPTTNLTSRGILIAKTSNIYHNFQKTHRELQGLLDQFELAKGRLTDLDPRVEEFLEGLGKTYSSHRALAETLGDIISTCNRTITDSAVGEAEKIAIFSRFFTNLFPVFSELQSAKLLMETHVGRLSAWLRSADGNLPSGFNDFLERHASSTLVQRFSGIYRISGDSLAAQQEYAALFKPLISERRIGAAEEMLTLLWTRESFVALRATIAELGSALSRYPSLKDIPIELESIVKARSTLINQRLSEARLKILLPNWEKNAAGLKSQLTRVQGRYTTPLPNVLEPNVTVDEIKRHISSELSRVIQENGNPASAISELVSEIDDAIDTITRAPATNGTDLIGSTHSLRAALSTLDSFIGHATNSLDEIEQLRMAGDLGSGINYVIRRPEIRQALREYIGLRRQIVENLEIQLTRIAP